MQYFFFGILLGLLAFCSFVFFSTFSSEFIFAVKAIKLHQAQITNCSTRLDNIEKFLSEQLEYPVDRDFQQYTK